MAWRKACDCKGTSTMGRMVFDQDGRVLEARSEDLQDMTQEVDGDRLIWWRSVSAMPVCNLCDTPWEHYVHRKCGILEVQ